MHGDRLQLGFQAEVGEGGTVPGPLQSLLFIPDQLAFTLTLSGTEPHTLVSRHDTPFDLSWSLYLVTGCSLASRLRWGKESTRDRTVPPTPG